MTILNLRTVRLRPGEQYHDALPVELELLELAGQRYLPVPESPVAALTISRVGTGTLFDLRLQTRLEGPCFRCLEPAAIAVSVTAREYQAASPGADEELSVPYLEDGRLDLSAWAHDAVALDLPEKVLCSEECAGLCPGCGANLNVEACTCPPPEPDLRFAKLAELRERLES